VEQLALVDELVEVRRAARVVEVPAVVLGGDHDGVVRPQAIEGLARLLPDGRLRMLDGGHLVPIEHPDAVADAVLDLMGASAHPEAHHDPEPGLSAPRPSLPDGGSTTGRASTGL
jgi:hypothetical protein